MAKFKPRKLINEGTKLFYLMFRDGLRPIAEGLIKSIVTSYKKQLPGSKHKAILGIKAKGVSVYKRQLLEGFALLSLDSLKVAAEEIGFKAKFIDDLESIKFGRHEKLPAKVRNRNKSQIDVLVDAQVKDLEKSLFFAGERALEQIPDPDTLTGLLVEAGDEHIDGVALRAGAGVQSAKVVNATRQIYFDLPEVEKKIQGYVFMNPAPKTHICRELKGRQFLRTDPNYSLYRPPLHFNCKSYYQPVRIDQTVGGKPFKGERLVSRKNPLTKAAQKQKLFSDIDGDK